MDYEQEERELWGYKFKATVQEDREIRRKFDRHPLIAEWRVVHLQVMHGEFESLTAVGVDLCKRLQVLEGKVEELASRLVEEHEKEN